MIKMIQISKFVLPVACLLSICCCSISISKANGQLTSQDEYQCNYAQNAEMYRDVGDLEELLAMQTLSDPPVIMEATNLRGSKPYIFEGYLIRPIYFQGLPYRGNCTLVFGWLSTPVSGSSSVPGAVLLHGGGGTALKKWNEQWALHGMASLSIGLEGQTDETKGLGYIKTPFPGPRRRHAYSDYVLPIQEQWMFHAVAQSMLATTLMRSLPFVNPDGVGVAGVSWGGAIASTLLSIDYERLAFAIPAYGCGSMVGSDSAIARQMHRYGAESYYNRVWDPTARLHRLFRSHVHVASIPPTLWISHPEEQSFPIERQKLTYETLQQHGAQTMVLLLKNLEHGHAAIMNRPESYAFVKAVMETRQAKLEKIMNNKNNINNTPNNYYYSQPLSSIKGDAYVQQIDHYAVPSIWVSNRETHTLLLRSRQPFKMAGLYYTCDSSNDPLYMKKFQSKPVSTIQQESCDDEGYCLYSLVFSINLGDPCAFYVNLLTDQRMVVSSTLFFTNDPVQI